MREFNVSLYSYRQEDVCVRVCVGFSHSWFSVLQFWQELFFQQSLIKSVIRVCNTGWCVCCVNQVHWWSTVSVISLQNPCREEHFTCSFASVWNKHMAKAASSTQTNHYCGERGFKSEWIIIYCKYKPSYKVTMTLHVWGRRPEPAGGQVLRALGALNCIELKNKKKQQ